MPIADLEIIAKAHENLHAGQSAFGHRARCVRAAALAKYTKAMESGLAVEA